MKDKIDQLLKRQIKSVVVLRDGYRMSGFHKGALFTTSGTKYDFEVVSQETPQRYRENALLELTDIFDTFPEVQE